MKNEWELEKEHPYPWINLPKNPYDALEHLIDIMGGNGCYERLNTKLASIDMLEKVVSKATPKKVKGVIEMSISNIGGYCPVCNTFVVYNTGIENDYCPHCGQALDWKVKTNTPSF